MVGGATIRVRQGHDGKEPRGGRRRQRMPDIRAEIIRYLRLKDEVVRGGLEERSRRSIGCVVI